jgi:trimeric autotransporter adhesin
MRSISNLFPILIAIMVFTAADCLPSAAEDLATLFQLEPAAGSAATIAQHGDDNRASVRQTYIAGGIPHQNQATQLQTGNGNSTVALQEGSQLSAVQEQTGSDNSSMIEQYGSGRAAAHIQIGDGHSATITQFGGAGDGSAGVTVTQFNFGAGQ